MGGAGWIQVRAKIFATDASKPLDFKHASGRDTPKAPQMHRSAVDAESASKVGRPDAFLAEQFGEWFVCHELFVAQLENHGKSLGWKFR